MSTDPNYYLTKITSEHNLAPKFVAMMGLFAQFTVDHQTQTLSMPSIYDLDNAVGVQLDAVGQWIFGSPIARFVQVPFPGGPLTRLDDAHFRILLKARIISNQWDGTVPGAYRAWAVLFAGTGLQVLIADHDNMTAQYGLTGPADAVTQALFQAGLLELKPDGVHITYVIGTPS